MDKNKVIRDGYSLMAESSVVICSIVRNANKSLIKNIPLVEKLRSKFLKSQIVVFENDSNDGTKGTLQKWSNTFPNVMVKCDDFNQNTIPEMDLNGVNKYFSYQRISKMTKYRNQYLQWLDSFKQEFDFLIVIDLDIEKFMIDGIAHSFGLENQWDVITANGYSYSKSLTKRYHDTYALVEIGNEHFNQTEEMIFNDQKKWSFLKPGIPLIPVYSAYGGLAIYRYEVVKNKKYKVLKNNDDRIEVRCEHFSINHLIHRDGYTRFFINPNMEVLYERITFSKIKNFFLSKFPIFNQD